jgi:hypothetical protein
LSRQYCQTQNIIIMDILSNITNGNANIEAIKTQLFDVQLVQLHPNLEGFKSPDSYGVYKGTGGSALGVVGNVFEPTQPKILFDAFENCLYDTDCDMSKVEYKTLKEDKKIIFKAPIKTIGFKNLRGQMDESIIHLNVQTGFDGKTSTTLFLSMHRLICANGMKGFATEFESKFKNTKNNVGKVNMLCEDVAKAIMQAETLENGLIHLNKMEVKQAEVDIYLKKVLGYNQKDWNELNTGKRNILNAINSSIALEFGRTGSTLWGLVNGITHYTNHVASTKNRLDYLYNDSGMKMNDLAQKVAFEMAN